MPLEFDRSFDPAHGEAVRVAPGIRRLTARNAGPFTFHGTNCYLLGDNRITVIDPGPDDEAQVAAIMAATAPGRVELILLTHRHRDHLGAAARLSRLAGAPVAAAAPPPLVETGGGADAPGEPGFRPDIILHDWDVVETEAGALRVVATPGHAADHLAFAITGTEHLFSGDHVMAWSTSVVALPGGSMGAYVASLDRVAALPHTVYWPGHGGPVRDGPRYAMALKAHRLDREAAILSAVAGGARTVADVVATVYAGLDPALVGAAGMSVAAHLEWLAEKGLVTPPPTGW